MRIEKAMEIYPECEYSLWKRNQELVEELRSSLTAVAKDDEQEYLPYFNPDGFFPFYTKQKVKILYIAKESLGLCGCDYIEIVMPNIINNNPRGQNTVEKPNKCTNNRDPMVSKVLYTTYSLNNGCCCYDDLPWAEDIGRFLFCKENGVIREHEQMGISYAFMNFSKFDNPSEDSYSADLKRMRTYADMCRRTGINWHVKQISLLNPDLIIDMNNLDEHTDMLGTKPVEWLDTSNNRVWTGLLPVNDKKYLLLKTTYFSAPGVSYQRDLLPRIIEAWQRYGKK